MSIPEDYDLHISDIMDVLKSCKDENKKLDVYGAIFLVFRLGLIMGNNTRLITRNLKSE